MARKANLQLDPKILAVIKYRLQGLTQREIAQKLGTHQPVVSKLLRIAKNDPRVPREIRETLLEIDRKVRASSPQKGRWAARIQRFKEMRGYKTFEVLYWRSKGFTQHQIAKKTGISPAYVGSLLRDADVYLHPTYRKQLRKIQTNIMRKAAKKRAKKLRKRRVR